MCVIILELQSPAIAVAYLRNIYEMTTFYSIIQKCNDAIKFGKNEGSAGIWTRDLLHPKQESYP